MKISVRQARPSDFPATEHLTREAFWNHYSPGCSEHYLLHVMRSCPAYVPELDLVAEYEGKVIGSSLCLRSVICGDDGEAREVLSLGPIAVEPDCQGMGIGGQLIDGTRKVAREMGFRAILLCGDPDYYSHQGFEPAEKHGIRTAENKYAAALHVCGLYPDALRCVMGRYYEDEIYNVDEAEAAEYDKQFPHKEKVTGTPTQDKFLKISAMQKDP